MIDCKGILDALSTFAMNSGYFELVINHEPRSTPQLEDQFVLSLTSGSLMPVQASGLNSISYRWQIDGRIYANADSEPADSIDPALVTAATSFLTSLAGGFSLGERLRMIDFYGAHGEQLTAQPGYYTYGDETFRTMDIVIPLILNDVMPLSRGA
jgi:hypothetical protein